MSRLVALTIALLVGGSAAIASAPAATAAEDRAATKAVASWSMVPQSKDANGDGIIDGDGGVPRARATSLTPSSTFVGAGNRIAQPHERLIGGALSWYLSPKGYPVRLDACASTGSSARWRLTSESGERTSLPWRALPSRCEQTVLLPEGRYAARLDVRGGGRTVSTTTDIEVRNLLVVVLGDSYAAGEGNPRNIQSWLRRGGTLTPYWDEDGCHRSARGAPALAALALEKASPRTSVTLVDVACSGATVASGILGAQSQAGQSASQIEQAAAIVGSRPVDLVLLSVGGNDVGFTSILQTCALSADCPLAPPSPGPLSGFPTVQDGVQARTGGLASAYASIADCLDGGDCRLADGRSTAALRLHPDGAVLPALYPDITRARDGAPCRYLSIGEDDFAWAQGTILSPTPPAVYPYPLSNGRTAQLSMATGSLNGQVAAAGRLDAWSPVAGTWSSWAQSPEGHGVCAGDSAWVFGYTGLSGFPSASFHPNPTGQRVMGREIAAAASAAVRP